MRYSVAIGVMAAFASASLAQNKAADVQKLIQQLKDRDRETRQDAVVLLGRAGAAAKDAVPALLAALKEPDLSSRAVIALTKIGAAGLPQLTTALKGNDTLLKSEAALIIGNIGSGAQAALPDVLNALKDQSAAVRSAALRAVGRIGVTNATVVSAVAPFLKDPVPATREQALRALIQLGPDAVKGEISDMGNMLQKDGDPAIRRLTAGALGDLGPDAKSALRALTSAIDDEDAAVRIAAAFALAQLGPEAKSAVASLKKTQKGADGPTALAAAFALSAIEPGNAGALDPITEALTNPADANSRMMAGYLLATIGPPQASRAVPALTKALRDKEDAVQLAAAAALVRLDPTNGSAAGRVLQALPSLTKEVQASEQMAPAHARIMMAEVLGALGARAKAAIPALQSAANDRNPRVRNAARKALKQIQGE